MAICLKWHYPGSRANSPDLYFLFGHFVGFFDAFGFDLEVFRAGFFYRNCVFHNRILWSFCNKVQATYGAIFSPIVYNRCHPCWAHKNTACVQAVNHRVFRPFLSTCKQVESPLLKLAIWKGYSFIDSLHEYTYVCNCLWPGLYLEDIFQNTIFL